MIPTRDPTSLEQRKKRKEDKKEKVRILGAKTVYGTVMAAQDLHVHYHHDSVSFPNEILDKGLSCQCVQQLRIPAAYLCMKVQTTEASRSHPSELPSLHEEHTVSALLTALRSRRPLRKIPSQIAIIDSGVDCARFLSRFSTKLVHLRCFRLDETLKWVDIPERASTDMCGHGTHIASVIAGAAQLVSTSITIFSFQLPQDLCVWAFISAIRTGAGLGCKVFNCSLGYSNMPTGHNGPNGVLCNLLDELQPQGVMLVCSVGNSGCLCPPVWPACLGNTYKFVIPVGALDETGNPYQWNCSGARVFAPGAHDFGGARSSCVGTSFAAAVVTAVVALFMDHEVLLQPPTLLQLYSERNQQAHKQRTNN